MKRIFVLFLVVVSVFAMKNTLHIKKNDDRRAILIGEFGFNEGTFCLFSSAFA